jgi:hypothetical protein
MIIERDGVVRRVQEMDECSTIPVLRFILLRLKRKMALSFAPSHIPFVTGNPQIEMQSGTVR